MQNGDDDDSERKERAARRIEAHVKWKQTFFLSRPAPSWHGRLHRQHHERKGGAPVHIVFKRARELVATEKRDMSHAQPSDPSALRCPGSSDNGEPSKEERWVQQMRQERQKRNPFTDLQAQSDPRRTVIMANLHLDTIDEELRVFADQFGRVTSLRIVRHSETGRSRRYAFVEFGLVAEARNAVTQSRRRRLRGRAISIAMERGRVDPRFQPLRMAEAAKYDEEASITVADQGAMIGAPPNGSASAKVAMDDETFLNSLLN